MKTRIMYIVGGLLALATVVGVSFLTVKLVGGSAAPAVVGGAPVAHVKITEENTVALEEFVTNLADDRRYIKVKLTLVLTSKDLKETMEESLPRVRDAIVQVLNAKKSVEVTGATGANTLKTDIKDALNKLLGANPVHEVLVTDFVVQ